MCEKEQFIKFMMAWAKRAVNYGFRQERLNLLPFQELAFLGGNTRQQNFWIRSRSHSLGRQLGCSGLGSEDTRKIDSTCHILPDGENASWDSLSSPGLWLPLRRKWARRLEWGNDRDECGPHAVIVWGGCPETGILTRFRTSSEAVATYKLCYSTSGISGLSQEACYPKSLSGKACKGETFRRMENIRRKRTSTPPSGGGFSDWIDGVDWIDCVDRGQNGHG